MSETRKRLIFAVFLAALPACSLFVSLDDLQDAGPGDASTNDAPFEAGRDAGTDIDSSAAVDASADADADIFFDDFDRPDASDIGNDWVEKTPAAFTLAQGAVYRTTDRSVDYPDNIAYRPLSESLVDQQISVEVVFVDNVSGYPQLHSRIQPSVTTPGTIDSYVFYISASNQVTISRTTGNEMLTDLTESTLTNGFALGERYRLTFRVTGAAPVELYGLVEHFASGSWTMIGQAVAADSDPAQLTAAGTVGFSASDGDSEVYYYDNFMRTSL